MTHLLEPLDTALVQCHSVNSTKLVHICKLLNHWSPRWHARQRVSHLVFSCLSHRQYAGPGRPTGLQSEPAASTWLAASGNAEGWRDPSPPEFSCLPHAPLGHCIGQCHELSLICTLKLLSWLEPARHIRDWSSFLGQNSPNSFSTCVSGYRKTVSPCLAMPTQAPRSTASSTR